MWLSDPFRGMHIVSLLICLQNALKPQDVRKENVTFTIQLALSFGKENIFLEAVFLSAEKTQSRTKSKSSLESSDLKLNPFVRKIDNLWPCDTDLFANTVNR